MSAAEFRQLLASVGMSHARAAAVLGVARVTTWRWSTGVTPIAVSSSKLIRAVIRPKRK